MFPEDTAGPLPGRGARWGVLAGLTLVTFLLLVDDTAVAVALPSIQEQLGIGFESLQWAVNAYTLAIAAFTLLAGRLADRNGPRPIFLIGLAVFIAGSFGAGLAFNAATLIAFRVVQGVGAALVAPSALALIAVTFSSKQRGLALGIWAGVSASALGIGPLFGAVLNDSVGWRWIFLLNLPLGAGAWLVARLVLPKSRVKASSVRLDLLGAFLSAAGLVGLISVLSELTDADWTSWQVILRTGLTVVLLGLFLIHESRTRDPLVDLALFRNRSFTGANLVTLLATAVMCSLFFFLALYLQTVLGLSALAAGASLLPLTVTIVVVAPLSGGLSDRFGARALVATGMLVLAAALLGLGTLGLYSSVASLMLWLALAGLGIGLARTPTTAAALGAVDGSKYGTAAGVYNTFQATGLAVGIALMGAILTSFGPDAAFDRDFDAAHHAAFRDGLSMALTINSGIAAVAAVLAAVLLRSRLQSPPAAKTTSMAAPKP